MCICGSWQSRSQLMITWSVWHELLHVPPWTTTMSSMFLDWTYYLWHTLYSPIQMMYSQKYSWKTSGLCFIPERAHFLQPESLCGQMSQTEAKIPDNAISTVYAWSVSPSGCQIVQNLILAFHAMDITVWVWYDLTARESHECQKC